MRKVHNKEMVEMTARVQNGRGIHCRPSGLIYKSIEHFKGDITLITKDMEVDLHSIMDIIILGLFKNDKVTIRVTGDRENVVCEKLKELFETKFDFPPKNECKVM